GRLERAAGDRGGFTSLHADPLLSVAVEDRKGGGGEAHRHRPAAVGHAQDDVAARVRAHTVMPFAADAIGGSTALIGLSPHGAGGERARARYERQGEPGAEDPACVDCHNPFPHGIAAATTITGSARRTSSARN